MELSELQHHIKTLAALEKTSAPVVSCYIDIEDWKAGNRYALEEQIKALKTNLSTGALRTLEETLARIEALLGAGLLPQTKGVAVFTRGGEQSLFLPLQFRIPLPNCVAVDSIPRIYNLVELKDTYYRYVVMLATEKRARILAIHLGSIVEDISTGLPDLRHRDGREWTKEHYRSHRRARINQFIREEIRTLDRMFTAGGYEHLVLAGNPRATSRINNALPAHLAAKLIDIVPASEYDRTRDVVAATLACFVEREEQESLSKVDKLLQEMKRHHGFAVSGTRASLAALMKGQVDVLVLAKGFQAEPAWACDKCDVIEVGAAIPPACPKCGERLLQIRDLKEDLVRLAERSGCEVEIVNHSDALMRVGGVGCLLRFLRPESYGTKAA